MGKIFEKLTQLVDTKKFIDYRSIELLNPDKIHIKSAPYKPQALMQDLVEILPDETHCIIDSGSILGWSIQYLFPKKAKKIWYGLGLASMGSSIGTGIGAALASPSTPVAVLVGDGAFIMQNGDFHTAVHDKLDHLIFIILNDGCYNMVKFGQKLTGAAPIGYDIGMVDFVKMAEAYGAEGFEIQSVEDLVAFKDKGNLSRQRGPIILDVRVDANEETVMGLRAQVLRRKAEFQD